MNLLKRGYIKLIFKIFTFSIEKFYRSNENTENTYNRMIQLKDIIYSFYNFITNGLSQDRQSYLMKINFSGLEIFIRPLILSDIIMTTKVWEPYVQKVFKPQKGDVVIDVGAHIGTYSIPKSIDVGNTGRIIACEPDKQNFTVLEKNVLINKLKNIVLIKKAISETNKKIKLVSTKDPMLSTINEKESDGIIVDCTNLDSLISELNLDNVDWIKIDAEGHEISILYGSKYILEKFKPKLIIETRVENQNEMKKILEKYNYNIEYLSGEYFYCF